MLDYQHTKSLALNAKPYTYFFSPDTMRFFNSRLSELAWIVSDKNGIQYAYFVTSERFNDATPRLYSIRRLAMEPGKNNWTNDTIGEFQQYKSSKQANAIMEKLAKQHDQESGATDNDQFRRAHIALRDKNRAA